MAVWQMKGQELLQPQYFMRSVILAGTVTWLFGPETHAQSCMTCSDHCPKLPSSKATGESGKKGRAVPLCSYQQPLCQNVLHQLEVVAKLFVLAAGPLHLLISMEAEVLRLILEFALLQNCKPQTHSRGQMAAGQLPWPTGSHRLEAAPRQV